MTQTENDTAIEEIAAVAARWRYDQSGDCLDEAQRMEDGLVLLQILQRHGIPWPMEEAMKVIPAPGMSRVSPGPVVPSNVVPLNSAAQGPLAW